MIITKNIEKKVTQYNLRIFKKFGFSIGDIAVVDIKYWDRNSHEKILVKCDICGTEKYNQYRQYMDSYEKYNQYSCSSKCSNFKNKKTCLEKYGDEKFFNFEKYKKTCLEKYGVDNAFKIIDIINKIDITKRNKYGPNLELVVNKMKETMFIKYGVDNISKLEEIKEIKRQTSFSNYGYYYPIQSEDIKRKSRETCLAKYGYEYPIQSDIIKNKRMETCLEKYGNKHYVLSNEWVMSVNIEGVKSPLDLLKYWKNTEDYKLRKEDIYERIKFSNIKNGNWYKDLDNEYKSYRRLVDNLSRKNIELLLDSWDGIDYYDNEYILPYYKLDYNNMLYPTIDHKISVKNGFLSNIPVEEISSVDNLCITKRTINSKKNSKNEDKFYLFQKSQFQF